MYHVFQQENEMSAVLFTETCVTEQELNDIIENSALPIMFVYDDVTNALSHSSGYYDLRETMQLVGVHLKR